MLQWCRQQWKYQMSYVAADVLPSCMHVVYTKQSPQYVHSMLEAGQLQE